VLPARHDTELNSASDGDDWLVHGMSALKVRPEAVHAALVYCNICGFAVPWKKILKYLHV
jgi:hypothetical protein